MKTGRSCRVRWRIAAAAHTRSDWSEHLSIKLFANGQFSHFFVTKCGLGTESSRWGTELLSARVVCNPWLRIIYIESHSVNTTMTKRQTIKSCSLNSTAIWRRVKSCSVNLALVKISCKILTNPMNPDVIMDLKLSIEKHNVVIVNCQHSFMIYCHHSFVML